MNRQFRGFLGWRYFFFFRGGGPWPSARFHVRYRLLSHNVDLMSRDQKPRETRGLVGSTGLLGDALNETRTEDSRFKMFYLSHTHTGCAVKWKWQCSAGSVDMRRSSVSCLSAGLTVKGKHALQKETNEWRMKVCVLTSGNITDGTSLNGRCFLSTGDAVFHYPEGSEDISSL